MICLMAVLMRSILYIHCCCFPAGHSWQMKHKLFNSIWNLTTKIPFLLDFGRLLQMMAESVLNNRSMWRRFSGRSLAEASLLQRRCAGDIIFLPSQFMDENFMRATEGCWGEEKRSDEFLANFRRVRDLFFTFGARCVCICFRVGSRCVSKTPMCLTSCGHKTCPRLQFWGAFGYRCGMIYHAIVRYKVYWVSRCEVWHCVLSKRRMQNACDLPQMTDPYRL